MQGTELILSENVLIDNQGYAIMSSAVTAIDVFIGEGPCTTCVPHGGYLLDILGLLSNVIYKSVI